MLTVAAPSGGGGTGAAVADVGGGADMARCPQRCWSNPLIDQLTGVATAVRGRRQSGGGHSRGSEIAARIGRARCRCAGFTGALIAGRTIRTQGPEWNSGPAGANGPGKRRCMRTTSQGNAPRGQSRREERVKTGGRPGNDWTVVPRWRLVRMVEGRPEGAVPMCLSFPAVTAVTIPARIAARFHLSLSRSAGHTPVRPALRRMSGTSACTAGGRRSRRRAGARCQTPAEVLWWLQDSGRHPLPASRVAGGRPKGGPGP